MSSGVSVSEAESSVSVLLLLANSLAKSVAKSLSLGGERERKGERHTVRSS